MAGLNSGGIRESNGIRGSQWTPLAHKLLAEKSRVRVDRRRSARSGSPINRIPCPKPDIPTAPPRSRATSARANGILRPSSQPRRAREMIEGLLGEVLGEEVDRNEYRPYLLG